jgi:predicted TIM-barrel fold metal-dependent hydrolase
VDTEALTQHPDASGPPDLPIKLGPCSNGEFVPGPASPLVRETWRRADADIEATSRRLGLSRRRFLGSLGASAAVLLALDGCTKDRASSERRPGGPGGTYSIPPESTTEPEAATGALAGDEFIMDVQGHLLDYDLDEPLGGYFGSGFPQAGCDADDPRACFDADHFLDLYFLQSDTSLVVLSAVPIVGPDSPLSIDVMERTRRIARALCRDDRVLLHGQANPNVGSLDRQLASMDELVADHPITAWKVYTHAPAPGWALDDPLGEAFLRKAAETRPIVCVHKGLSGGSRYASPADVGPAAKAHPDISFVVYHSGYESGQTEGPYEDATRDQGVNRLITSLRQAGIGPGDNVYAELGSTWRLVMADPTQAAHVLGKLLVAVGPERILWGTDSIWYGSPQDQIQAFRAFQITEEFQDRYGYPPLTDDVKLRILGRNAAALYEVEPEKVACPFTREELQAAREAEPAAFRTYGPTTARQVGELIAQHGGLAR